MRRSNLVRVSTNPSLCGRLKRGFSLSLFILSVIARSGVCDEAISSSDPTHTGSGP